MSTLSVSCGGDRYMEQAFGTLRLGKSLQSCPSCEPLGILFMLRFTLKLLS